MVPPDHLPSRCHISDSFLRSAAKNTLRCRSELVSFQMGAKRTDVSKRRADTSRI